MQRSLPSGTSVGPIERCCLVLSCLMQRPPGSIALSQRAPSGFPSKILPIIIFIMV